MAGYAAGGAVDNGTISVNGRSAKGIRTGKLKRSGVRKPRVNLSNTYGITNTKANVHSAVTNKVRGKKPTKAAALGKVRG